MATLVTEPVPTTYPATTYQTVPAASIYPERVSMWKQPLSPVTFYNSLSFHGNTLLNTTSVFSWHFLLILCISFFISSVELSVSPCFPCFSALHFSLFVWFVQLSFLFLAWFSLRFIPFFRFLFQFVDISSMLSLPSRVLFSSISSSMLAVFRTSLCFLGPPSLLAWLECSLSFSRTSIPLNSVCDLCDHLPFLSYW